MQQAVTDQALMASIRIFYQPVVGLADLRPGYVEVLARAAADDGSLAGPETIVDAMTEPRRSMRLTAHIMRRALSEYREFGFEAADLSLAFNLPLDAMLYPELVASIEDIRARSQLDARHIRFELTERHAVHDLESANAIIGILREAGYGLALDDITPAMPNLRELMHMPISAIKLDRSVVTSRSDRAQNFIRDMVAQAASQQQDIIAEGIETSETLGLMQSLGVTHGQGFLFARPLSAAALQNYLLD